MRRELAWNSCTLVVPVIPVLYIVLAVGQVSAGAMAVDAGAARSRAFAEDPAREADASPCRCAHIVEDFGIDAQADVVLNCVGCEGDGGAADACVRAQPPAAMLVHGWEAPAWVSPRVRAFPSGRWSG